MSEKKTSAVDLYIRSVDGNAHNSAVLIIGKLEEKIENISRMIHYPESWDTATYPRLEDALREICSEYRRSDGVNDYIR